MVALLRISDGTDEISLIDIAPGIHLNNWTPAIAQYKGGGVFRNNPQATGRRLVQKTFDSVIETFDIKINNLDRNGLIRETQELLRLLEKATDYWTADWQNTIVYLIAQAECEDNIRYAPIVSYSIPQLGNPYAQPFLGSDGVSVFDNITLVIERMHWLESIPSQSTLLEISAIQQASPQLGVTATTDNIVHFGNQGRTGNITHIFVDNGGVFTDESPPATLPFDLLPDPLAANDALYIGSTDGAFTSAIFDIGIAASGLNGAWEYSQGAGVFAGLSLFDFDHTAGFTVTGVNGYFTEIPPAWVTDTVNGVVAHWIRFRQISAPGATTIPTQQNRDIYAVTQAFIDIAAAQVPGDILALAMLEIYNRSLEDGFFPLYGFSRVIWGTRDISRGSDFAAYLNIASSQNPTGVTVAVSGANTAFVSDVAASPIGEHGRWTPGAAATMDTRFTITLDNTLVDDYYGKYHAFLRMGALTITGGEAAKVRLRVDYDESTSFISKEATILAGAVESLHLADLGQVPLQHDIDTTNQIILNVQASQTDATGATLNFIDLVLIPIDEIAIDAETVTVPSIALPLVNSDSFLEIESLRNFKNGIRGVLKITATGRVRALTKIVNNNEVSLQSNAQQRLWFLFATTFSAPTGDRSNFGVVNTLQLFRNAQYLGSRGDR